MLSENDDRQPRDPAGDLFQLLPWQVIAGCPACRQDARMIGAQSALNRMQVWIGDLFIDLAAWRAERRTAKRAPEPGRALPVVRTDQTDRQIYFSSI